jgi:GNAT superfamily N-acetyltransferase
MGMVYIYHAKIDEAEILLSFIKELADYEKMLDKVSGDVEDIKKTFFCNNPKVKAIFLKEYKESEEILGFAIYFYNYSTFLCKHGIYIEDIYIKEKHRGHGFGKKIFQFISQIAIDKDCGRVEWWCLDWNKKSIEFYLKMGAEAMIDWTVYRLTKKEIIKIRDEF